MFPAAKLDLYPLEDIQLPTDQQPPKNMPPIAWSNSGELVGGAYTDIAKLRPQGGLKPGEVLPPDTVKELRRGYYSAVSHMDDQVGTVMEGLKQTGYYENTVVSFWGDHGWQLYVHNMRVIACGCSRLLVIV